MVSLTKFSRMKLCEMYTSLVAARGDLASLTAGADS